MKHYPSITKEIFHNIDIYAFDKLDGSQIRAEWNSKKGFYKFGTKNQLIDASTKPWGRSTELIRSKYENDLGKIFLDQKWKDAICFFELWGSSSFAGNHNFEEELTVTLFDVNPYKQGILEPKEFICFFGHLDVPKVLYTGRVTVELFDQIKQSTLPGMTFEGVVAKGASQNKSQMPTMFKVKSRAWLEKLRLHCKGNEKLFAMLE
jgi:RNA ligase